jgi:hypothetical protein
MNKKKLIGALKSKTVWFNIITGALELINALAVPLGIQPGVLTIVAAVGNVALRFLTSHPLEQKA